MDWLLQDLRFTFRALARTPAFLVIVILTLGLGIGANAAIFSLLDQALLRQLPIQRPEQLVQLDCPDPCPFQGRAFNRQTFSYPSYVDFRDQNTVFDGVIARFPASVTMSWQGDAERIQTDIVSGNYFDVLGVRPQVGRLLTASDDGEAGENPVVVLSHGFWVRRFGADPTVLNQEIHLNGRAMTVVGVTPQGFNGIVAGLTPDVMVPLSMRWQMIPIATDWLDADNRRSRWLNVLARLKPGVSIDQAQASMNVLFRQISEVEAKLLESQSESFRKRVVERKMTADTGGHGHGRRFQAVDRHRHRGADGDGRDGAAHRLRERRQSAGGSRHRSAEGSRDPPGPRLRPLADRPSASHREHRARGCGRWRRACCCRCGSAGCCWPVFRPTVRRACSRPIPIFGSSASRWLSLSSPPSCSASVRRSPRLAPISRERSTRSHAGRAAARRGRGCAKGSSSPRWRSR